MESIVAALPTAHMIHLRRILLPSLLCLEYPKALADASSTSTPPSDKALGGGLGKQHSCAIRIDGALKCWGHNSNGQLGLGHTTTMGNSAGEMASLPNVNIGSSKTATDVCLGQRHTCVLLNDETIKCWGSNSHGQLGIGEASSSVTDAAQAATVNLGTSLTAKGLACGKLHTCALTSGNGVKCWGRNARGQLGNDINPNIVYAPDEHVAVGEDVAQVASDSEAEHTCARTTSGKLKCWGWNGDYQLGLALVPQPAKVGHSPGSMASFSFVNLGSLWTVTSVAVGAQHTCVILNTQRVLCFGSNDKKQLGIHVNGGSSSTSDNFVSNERVALSDSVAHSLLVNLGTSPDGGTPLGARSHGIAAGNTHTCAVLTTGALMCWGSNSAGQLGTGTETSSTVNIGQDLQAYGVRAAAAHTCVLLAPPAQRVKCFGSLENGRLGQLCPPQGAGTKLGDANEEMGDNLQHVMLYAPPTPQQPQTGWSIAAQAGQSCTDHCAALGGDCDASTFSGRHGDVDSSDEVLALIEQRGGSGTFQTCADTCTSSNQVVAPAFTASSCLAAASSSQMDCSSTSEGKTRLCYCSVPNFIVLSGGGCSNDYAPAYCSTSNCNQVYERVGNTKDGRPYYRGVTDTGAHIFYDKKCVTAFRTPALMLHRSRLPPARSLQPAQQSSTCLLPCTSHPERCLTQTDGAYVHVAVAEVARQASTAIRRKVGALAGLSAARRPA